MYSQEEIKKAEAIDIVDYCNQNDIALKSDNERYYRLVDHDSCVIDRSKNAFYWNSRSKGGNVINFVQEYEGVNFRAAMKLLQEGKHEYVNNQTVEYVSEPYEYSSQNEVTRFDKARTYLIEERKIDSEIVDDLHNRGLLKQDKNNNVLFLWKEYENVMGCSEQGTFKSDKYKRGSWKSIQKNSTANYGFNVKYGEPKHLKFFESSIDALSYATLHKDKLEDTQLVSMEGLKHNTLLNYVIKAREELGCPPESIAICVDNDKAGRTFADKFRMMEVTRKDGSTYDFEIDLPGKANGKDWDWNDELKEKLKSPEEKAKEEIAKTKLYQHAAKQR